MSFSRASHSQSVIGYAHITGNHAATEDRKRSLPSLPEERNLLRGPQRGTSRMPQKLLRATEVEARRVWSRAGLKGWGKRQNTRQPAAFPPPFQSGADPYSPRLHPHRLLRLPSEELSKTFHSLSTFTGGGIFWKWNLSKASEKWEVTVFDFIIVYTLEHRLLVQWLLRHSELTLLLDLAPSPTRLVVSCLVAVAERLACSPPTKTNLVQSPARSLPEFRMWVSCWSAGFLRDLQFSPPFHSGAALYSLQSFSSALKTLLQPLTARTYLEFIVSYVQALSALRASSVRLRPGGGVAEYESHNIGNDKVESFEETLTCSTFTAQQGIFYSL
ncbi:hypothetical protein PR048_020263 [Dryococelus australis]|uniref:Uncharacterized protein n=1 Tax=Dryococelus australis TaxID=614101 RepID=A0ABQ9H5Y1_9NEOP|nr:hypothetical protein PR048_020263 [Dryococelus australis]